MGGGEGRRLILFLPEQCHRPQASRSATSCPPILAASLSVRQQLSGIRARCTASPALRASAATVSNSR
eukprot:1319967-Pleurochrysis_carterae.AAC.1